MNEERDRMMNKCLERIEKQMEAFTTIFQGFKEGQWGNVEKFQIGNPNLPGISEWPAQNKQDYGEGTRRHNNQNVRVEDQLVGNQSGLNLGRGEATQEEELRQHPNADE